MAPANPLRLIQRAWYAASFDDFSGHSNDEIVGQLIQQSNHAVELAQRDAWLAEIELLRGWLKGRNGTLLLEFNIPRMGLRADAVLVIAGCVVILEFKVGDSTVGQGALNQVWQYALDTKNFHETSHGLPIIPVFGSHRVGGRRASSAKLRQGLGQGSDRARTTAGARTVERTQPAI